MICMGACTIPRIGVKPEKTDSVAATISISIVLLYTTRLEKSKFSDEAGFSSVACNSGLEEELKKEGGPAAAGPPMSNKRTLPERFLACGAGWMARMRR